MNDREMKFMEQLMKAVGGGQAVAVPNAEVEALKAQVAKLTEMISAKPTERRV